MPRRVIVGLGNPGPKYRFTRHNVGYLVIDRLLAATPPSRSYTKFHADCFEIPAPVPASDTAPAEPAPEPTGGFLAHLFGRSATPAETWLLVKPTTFMNLSGQSVAAVVDYYDLPLDQLLVVCDDIHLPLGRLRLRRGGSHGGQKGLKDILAKLAGQEVPRLRVGIETPQHADQEVIDHVLGAFTEDERPIINDAIGQAAEAVRVWGTAGIDEAMNRFNAAGM